MSDATSDSNEQSVGYVPDATPGIGPETRERMSFADKLPARQRSASSSSPDNKNKSSSRHKATSSFQQIEKKVQNHMDLEDKRVGEVVEGILYEFLTSAFNVILPLCGDPRTELTHDRCKLVASAALSIGALLNAPPPFLEFLLRIPWQKADEPPRNIGNQEWIKQQLEIPDELRKELVNTPIHPDLIPTVLEFIFSESYRDSLPPNLRSPTVPVPQSHIDKVGALLDGAGPLHCAAIRGNPAQVDHLLSCGADPTVKTAPGDLPLQLVPFCGEKDSHSNQRMCRCMNERDQEVWECRSISARDLIARKCFFSFGQGIAAWLTLVVLCILNALELWGCHSQLVQRRVIMNHVEQQMEAKATKAYLEAKRLLNEMRKEARQGHRYLAAARKMCLNVGKDRTLMTSDENFTEKAFASFVHAVHFLQNLLLHNDGKDFNAYPQTAPPSLPKVTEPDCQVDEDERSDLYCCWAESVLLKFQSCRCPGCAAIAVQAIRRAHIRCAELLTQLEKHSYPETMEMYESVGCNLMQVVYCHICLLLDTDACQSATKASMWRADQCIREWKRLEEKNFRFECYDKNQVVQLENWVRTAESDLMLAEALYGDLLVPSQTVSEILKLTVTQSSRRMPYLLRLKSLEDIDSLELALKKAKAPSSDLALLTMKVLQNGKFELQAAARLKECMGTKPTSIVAEMTEKLADAIKDAEYFPRLAMEVKAARQLHQELLSRSSAIKRLEVIMLQSKQPIEVSSDAEGSNVEASIIQERITALQHGIEQGKDARINTEKAKKLMRELQAQMVVVEAGHQLDVVMAKRPCGAAALKAALLKAENCCSSVTGPHSGLISFSEYLLPRIQAARKRQEIERVVESLNKAKATYRTVNDLSKLEGIILDARKVFDEVSVEECDQEVYNAARALRGTLHDAAKIQQRLQNCVIMLEKRQRKVDAVALEGAIQQAASCRYLVEEDVTKAQQALDHWNCTVKMAELLRRAHIDSQASSELSKAIQEAASVGVKTQYYKKVLKLMQNVEHAIEQLRDKTITFLQFSRIVDEAEEEDISWKMIGHARMCLRDAKVSQAKKLLSTAWNGPETDWKERNGRLSTALKRALGLVDRPPAGFTREVDADSFKHAIKAYRCVTTTDRTSEMSLLLEYMDKTVIEIQRCRDEQQKKLEEEKAQRAKDLKLERQRQEKEKAQKAKDLEIEKQRQAKEKAQRAKDLELERQRLEAERAQKAKDLELERQRQEQEEAQRAKDLELERQRQEKEKEEARQKELERQQKEREEAARREEQLKVDQRQIMEMRLQRSLEEKQKIEKRLGIFKRHLVDSISSETMMQTLSPVHSLEASRDDSYALMEHDVQRLIEDDGSGSSQKSLNLPVTCSYDSSDHALRVKGVRGVLESLDDPWGIQTEDTLPATSEFPSHDVSPKFPASLDLSHYGRHSVITRSDPLEALLAQSRAKDCMRTQTHEGTFSMKSIPRLSQIPDTMPSWSQPSGLVGRKSAPLDSSAPAFYPSASRELMDHGKAVNVLSSGPMIPSPVMSPSWRPVRALEVPKFSSAELPRVAVSPFPGVGAGIPGTPSRSLSDNVERLRQPSIARSEKDVFSRSGDL